MALGSLNSNRKGAWHVYTVPRPEHLAAMKAFSIKNDPERTLRELADIRVLLDVPDVEKEEVNRYFVRYGLEDLFDRLDEN